MVVSVAVTAEAATIQEIGRGSGVILSYRKVLKNWFSTPQASWPEKASRMIAIQILLDKTGLMLIVSFRGVLASVPAS
jgi:hypothetical protein